MSGEVNTNKRGGGTRKGMTFVNKMGSNQDSLGLIVGRRWEKEEERRTEKKGRKRKR